MNNFIEFKNVTKGYKIGDKTYNALDNVSFSLPKGEFVCILGPSGAGKSTLLNLLGGMDTVTSGDIIIDKENISKKSDKELTSYRAENVGFIFQFYNILPTLTVLENVEIVKDIVKNPKLLLCDEPTGALDSKTGVEVLKLLKKQCDANNGENTVIIVTHNALIAEVADRVIRLKNGQIESNTVNKHPKNIDEVEW